MRRAGAVDSEEREGPVQRACSSYSPRPFACFPSLPSLCPSPCPSPSLPLPLSLVSLVSLSLVSLRTYWRAGGRSSRRAGRAQPFSLRFSRIQRRRGAARTAETAARTGRADGQHTRGEKRGEARAGGQRGESMREGARGAGGRGRSLPVPKGTRGALKKWTSAFWTLTRGALKKGLACAGE